MSEPEFTVNVVRAVEHAVIKLLSKGDWLTIDYQSRPQIGGDLLRRAWATVDLDRVLAKLRERIEDMLVERICNAMATELATDVKQLLSVPERREAIRAVAREHLSQIARRGTEVRP